MTTLELLALLCCPSCVALRIETAAASSDSWIVTFAVPEVIGCARTRKLVKPATFTRQYPGAVALLAMVPVPCTPLTLYHVVPPSGDASNRTVSVKVPRSCTSAVCWPVTLMETVSPSLVTEPVLCALAVAPSETSRLPLASRLSASPWPDGSLPPTSSEPSSFRKPAMILLYLLIFPDITL